ncbi:glucose-6-phosphate dehydrogenase [Novosphingobium sp. CECT 9465]|uniref:glucose-6-phosphate dehydrogenase n=1 Tax=Novosphingobium sp. CECT 9465 TaxID=2829794 RepID=UPI001E54ECAA|nr:glucose-6-phosphate dehydrogenase [Novosphingobium sp. CECT 9465]CAH0498910.1 Glucose-6-phosphate 1-dehydrogenase [Novosphingobium sp. CECT 9465]
MKTAPPATLVIFGATGDLTRRLLVPAVTNLCTDGLLGKDFTILGIGRSDGDDETLRASLDKFATEGDCWRDLRKRIAYLQGDFTADRVFDDVAQALGDRSAVFYLATPAHFFGAIVEKLAVKGLMAEAGSRFRRVAIEKPFGHDLASAKALDARILALLPESQIYRLDHFLGKETVQNILVARFANQWFEAVWNNRYIDHVQITAAETVEVGSRGSFYDATGALRDMVPNHLFQLLAIIAMEPPNSFDADAIRDEKAKVLRAIRKPTAVCAVRGQYGKGRVGSRNVPAYRKVPDVAADSRTETYVALKLEVDTWRWAGVPFYLRTGKALAARDTEIVVTFKAVPYALFRDCPIDRLPANRLIFQLQPDESIVLDMLVKKPGPVIKTAGTTLDFTYADHFKLSGRTGYETLLYDMMTGDQTLFQRAEQIEAGWAAVQPILDDWAKGKGRLESYAPGSAGPAGADALLGRDGRFWHRIGQ